MTSRKFKCRENEYLDNIKWNRKTTALARLHKEEIIHINLNESKIIFLTKKYYSCIISETKQILTRKNSICNDHPYVPYVTMQHHSTYQKCRTTYLMVFENRTRKLNLKNNSNTVRYMNHFTVFNILILHLLSNIERVKYYIV